MTPNLTVARAAGILVVVYLVAQVLTPAFAQGTYAMTLQTNSSSYSGTQPIVITGTISPAPGPNTGVVITITNSAGSLADIAEENPDASTGAFSYTSYPGGNAAWTTGTFTVNATWGGDGTATSEVVTFTYTAAATSTTSTSTSTLTTTTSSTSTSKSTTSSASSTTTSTSSTTSTTSSSSTQSTSSTALVTTSTSKTVPEFPSGALAAIALVVMAFVAIASRRVIRPGQDARAMPR